MCSTFLRLINTFYPTRLELFRDVPPESLKRAEIEEKLGPLVRLEEEKSEAHALKLLT